MGLNVAIIGAGVSGLACASELTRHGHSVVVFEKSRGAGGRAPTRWLDRESSPPLGFDHGAQYFHVRSSGFRQVIEQASSYGVVAPWEGRIVNLSYGQKTPVQDDETRWVGVPGMASLGKYLALELNVHYDTRVTGLVRDKEHIRLEIQKGANPAELSNIFDWVISAIPCEQVNELFSKFHPPLAKEAAKVKSSVNWTCMLSFDQPIPVDFDGALVYDSPLGWICRDSSKPGRASGERWLLQATSDWSQAHVQLAAETASEMLIDVFRNVLGLSVTPDRAVSHRWLYALPENPLDCGYYLDRKAKIAACGDWLSRARVEDAYLSGQSLASEIKSS